MTAWARSSSIRRSRAPMRPVLYAACPTAPSAAGRERRPPRGAAVRRRAGARAGPRGRAAPRRRAHAPPVPHGRRAAGPPRRPRPAVELLDRLAGPEAEGTAKPDTYAAMVELTAPISRTAGEAARAIGALRARVRAAGGTVLGAGIHPDGAHGDVVHFPAERYAVLAEQLPGLLRRTPTAAVHVHVAMPDAETAIRTCNGLRDHLPALGALAANSPFWFGRDSGMASARAPLFRAYRGAEIPRAFSSYDEYAATIAATVAAGELE